MGLLNSKDAVGLLFHHGLAGAIPNQSGQTSKGDVKVICMVHPDRSLHVLVSDTAGLSLSFQSPQLGSAPSVAVEVTWDHGLVTLRVDKSVIETRDIRQGP